MALFSVTYEIWMPHEYDDCCDADQRGFIGEAMGLRDALEAVGGTRTSAVGGVECIEPNDSRIEHARWFTVSNSMEFETGAYEQRSLHIPDSVTGATRRRIARLMGVRT